MSQNPLPEKIFKSRLNEPQVWVFLFVFFAALPLLIYFQTLQLYLEDNFNRNRDAMVSYHNRELTSFGSKATNRQIFLQQFQSFRDSFKRNIPEQNQNAHLIKSLVDDIPGNSSIILWNNRGQISSNSILPAGGLASETAQGFVEMLLNSFIDFTSGSNLQTLHQIKKFEQQNAAFFASLAPLLGRGFPISQAITSPNTMIGDHLSTAEVFFYWDFLNNRDNTQGGFAVIIPLRDLSPTFGLSQVLTKDPGANPEFTNGYFDQTSGKIELSFPQLMPVASEVVKKFQEGLNNPLFVDDWVIFAQPQPDSSSTSIFTLFSTRALRESYQSDLHTARIIGSILLLSAAFIFFHYYRLAATKGLSLRNKMAALFFLCMQLPVSILIFLGIRFSISQEKLLSNEAENRLTELVKKVDASTLDYYRSVNEWLKSIKNLPELVKLDKEKMHETFFQFTRNNQLESYYLIGLDGNIEFDIDNIARENAGNRLFIKELGMRILANHSGDVFQISGQTGLDEGLFELVTRKTGTMHQVFWPGSNTHKFIFSDVITTGDGRKFASIAAIAKTELDRNYLRQAVTNQFKISPDREIIILKEDDISDTYPRLSAMFRANLLPIIATSKLSNNIATDLITDDEQTMLVALSRGINARDFLIGARFSWHKIMETIHLTYILVGIGLFFSLAASVFLVTVLIREFLAPVSVLSIGARAISNGDLNMNLPVFAKDELGELSTIFNLMTRRLRNRLTELTVLYNLTQKASTTHSQREVFELAAENLQQHLSADGGGTVWLNDSDNENELYLSDHLGETEAAAIRASARVALRTCRETFDFDEAYGKHILSLPLFFEEKKFGAIYLVFDPDRFKDKKGFSDDEKSFMETLRHHLALIIEKQRLFEQAITDGLTHLYLRRFFLATLDKEISRSKRYQLDLSLLLLDIDLFKKFNDTYGHQAGDYVLRETAQRIVENIRSVDTPGRYGGEEIILLLPQTAIKEAYLVGERIRKAIEGAEYKFRDDSMRVTVSIGVTSLHMRNLSMEELIEEADKALYVAKGKGRNQVRIAPEAM